MIPWPYDRYGVPVDMVFAVSDEHARVLTEQGIPRAHVVEVGLPWIAGIRDIKKKYTKELSRNILRIPSDVGLCVLVDPSNVMRGYNAPAEQALLLTTMFDLARSHPKLHLIIKPHPGHESGMLEELLSDYSLQNITEVPKRDLPYHALTAAEVLVTKFSLLAVEGMVLGVPSIGVLLDGEARFTCFENAADYVFNTQDLKALIVKLLEDRVFRERWNETRRVNAHEYLKRHSSSPLGDPNQIIATTLRQKLNV